MNMIPRLELTRSLESLVKVNRGLSTVYRLITNRAVESVDNGDYEHTDWARDHH